MPLSPAFTVAQSGLTPESFTVTDTSTGSDVNIVERRIYIQDAFGNYLTGNGTVNYDIWALVDLAITYSSLTEDIGANIRVDWVNISGGIVETLNNNYPLSEIGKQFFYYLLQLQGLRPGVYMDTNYVMNLAMYWVNIIAGDHAINFGNDLSSAQNCYSRETGMRLEQAKYF